MIDKGINQVMEEAHLHASQLKGERINLGKLPDDQRVATEIAAHQFQLGRFKKLLTEQNQRSCELIERNSATIAELESIFARLQEEMDFATHRKI